MNEALVATLYASKFMFDKLPVFAKKVLQLNGGFEMYDVVYDDESQCKQLEQRAKALGVVLNNGKGLKADAEFESCSGKIGACIKYLRHYLDADSGYLGGVTMYLDQPNDVTDEEFTEFCQWMSQWLPNFIDGIKQNRPLGKKLMTYNVNEDNNQHIAKQIIDQFSKDFGIDCSVDIVDNAHVNVHGNFDDKFPLKCLTFYWTPKDEYHEYGWHEGTKCMNKWRSLGAEAMNRAFLDGLNVED